MTPLISYAEAPGARADYDDGNLCEGVGRCAEACPGRRGQGVTATIAVSVHEQNPHCRHTRASRGAVDRRLHVIHQGDSTAGSVTHVGAAHFEVRRAVLLQLFSRMVFGRPSLSKGGLECPSVEQQCSPHFDSIVDRPDLLLFVAERTDDIS